MELHLRIVGVMLVVLALIHAIFPRYLKWKTELVPLSLMNQQLLKVHTFFIALMVLLMGLLCLSSADQLANTALGKKISLGLATFWGIRLLIQFFGYSPKLWKGKPFETFVHILFSLFWIYFTLVFFQVGIT